MLDMSNAVVTELPSKKFNPLSINSIKDLYPDIRQDSKEPTFLLTYQGTYHGLIANLGWTKTKSLAVETSYHTMYAVSDEWIREHLIEATKTGYIETAFGLRLRTPVLKQTLLGTSHTPYEAQGEARTAGNALGQGWGMLNNRAGIEFRGKVLASVHKYNIRPSAHIHDAQYFMIRNTINCVEWFNNNLVPCMQWQQDPLIQHPTVTLGGDVEVFHPNWSIAYTLPNNASPREIVDICSEKHRV